MPQVEVDDGSPKSVPTAVSIPRVLVAIVNYCTPNLVHDCLKSLEPVVRDRPGTRVVVADNASPDGSGRLIEKTIEKNGWSSWARILLLEKNGGFAYGNNAIIRSWSDLPPDYCWLINSDTVVRADALEQLLAFVETRPAVGIAGSRLEFHDGRQQVSTFRFPNIVGEFAASAPVGRFGEKLLSSWIVAEPISLEEHECDWVSGASMLVRRQAMDEVGLMDEAFFLYYEETDFCRRAKNLGWQCWFVPKSRVVHLIGASTGVTGVRPGRPNRRPKYWFSSRRRYFLKNHGRPYAIAADVALITAIGVRQIVEKLRGRESGVPEHFLLDLIRNSTLLSNSKL